MNPDLLRTLLTDLHHTLCTLNGLRASEGLNAYHQALTAGSDPTGAWDAFTEQTWVVDTTEELSTIDAALAAL